MSILINAIYGRLALDVGLCPGTTYEARDDELTLSNRELGRSLTIPITEVDPIV
jgi:hypothetical protein